VRSQNEARAADLKTGVRADPLVQAVLARFPGAEIVDVRKLGTEAAPADSPDDDAPPPADDTPYGADWLMDEGGETDQDG
jgi:DNA polymerase-3 subunit gamma/tau